MLLRVNWQFVQSVVDITMSRLDADSSVSYFLTVPVLPLEVIIYELILRVTIIVAVDEYWKVKRDFDAKTFAVLNAIL